MECWSDDVEIQCSSGRPTSPSLYSHVRHLLSSRLAYMIPGQRLPGRVNTTRRRKLIEAERLLRSMPTARAARAAIRPAWRAGDIGPAVAGVVCHGDVRVYPTRRSAVLPVEHMLCYVASRRSHCTHMALGKQLVPVGTVEQSTGELAETASCLTSPQPYGWAMLGRCPALPKLRYGGSEPRDSLCFQSKPAYSRSIAHRARLVATIP